MSKHSFLTTCILTIMAASPLSAQTVTIQANRPGHEISPTLYNGMLFEEINHGIDGGFYAELLRNGSFEDNNPIDGWVLVAPHSSQTVNRGYLSRAMNSQANYEASMVNDAQRYCARWEVGWNGDPETGMANTGYWGIRLEDNTTYRASFYARRDPILEGHRNCFEGTLTVCLESNDGEVWAESEPVSLTAEWQKFTFDLTTKGIRKPSGNNRFVIYGHGKGIVQIDLVSLMPPTFKDRPNGLRKDLGELIDVLHPKLIRFPGGCDVESCTVEHGWNWKKAIGPVDERPGKDVQHWHYRNSQRFGLDEMLRMCEDFGAEPVYCVSAGIDDGYLGTPLDKMQPLIDDLLDLIEYCNGGTDTRWGAVRASNGHPAPYNLKYIEVGNENGFGETDGEGYNERYELFYNAIKARYPDMNVIINDRLDGMKADFVDEHFFKSYESFFDEVDRYDSYDRRGPKVMVGEYCCKNNQKNLGCLAYAIAEAAFLTGCERNSDIVVSTAYATLSANLNATNYVPDLIYNNSEGFFAIPSYYMQRMFVENTGDHVLPYSVKDCGLYVAPSVETSTGDIIIKVVNRSEEAVDAEFALNGFRSGKAAGKALVLTSDDLWDGNSIDEPHKIVPREEGFSAGRRFNYSFAPISVTVLRIPGSR